jgi:hypothetical protein
MSASEKMAQNNNVDVNMEDCRADGLTFETLSTPAPHVCEEACCRREISRKGAKLYHAEDNNTLQNLLIVSYLGRISYAVF